MVPFRDAERPKRDARARDARAILQPRLASARGVPSREARATAIDARACSAAAHRTQSLMHLILILHCPCLRGPELAIALHKLGQVVGDVDDSMTVIHVMRGSQIVRRSRGIDQGQRYRSHLTLTPALNRHRRVYWTSARRASMTTNIRARLHARRLLLSLHAHLFRLAQRLSRKRGPGEFTTDRTVAYAHRHGLTADEDTRFPAEALARANHLRGRHRVRPSERSTSATTRGQKETSERTVRCERARGVHAHASAPRCEVARRERRVESDASRATRRCRDR